MKIVQEPYRKDRREYYLQQERLKLQRERKSRAGQEGVPRTTVKKGRIHSNVLREDIILWVALTKKKKGKLS